MQALAPHAHFVIPPQCLLQPLLVVRIPLAWLHHHDHHCVLRQLAIGDVGAVRVGNGAREAAKGILFRQLRRLTRHVRRVQRQQVTVQRADLRAETAKRCCDGVQLHLQAAQLC